MQQKRQIDDALAVIGNNHSLPVFVESFKLTASLKYASLETRFRLNQRLLYRLIQFRSRAGFLSIAECIDIARSSGLSRFGNSKFESAVIDIIESAAGRKSSIGDLF